MNKNKIADDDNGRRLIVYDKWQEEKKTIVTEYGKLFYEDGALLYEWELYKGKPDGKESL